MFLPRYRLWLPIQKKHPGPQLSTVSVFPCSFPAIACDYLYRRSTQVLSFLLYQPFHVPSPLSPVITYTEEAPRSSAFCCISLSMFLPRYRLWLPIQKKHPGPQLSAVSAFPCSFPAIACDYLYRRSTHVLSFLLYQPFHVPSPLSPVITYTEEAPRSSAFCCISFSMFLPRYRLWLPIQKKHPGWGSSSFSSSCCIRRPSLSTACFITCSITIVYVSCKFTPVLALTSKKSTSIAWARLAPLFRLT